MMYWKCVITRQTKNIFTNVFGFFKLLCVFFECFCFVCWKLVVDVGSNTLLLEVLFIGPQYNLYAVLGPMLLTLGLGVACWPLCIVCGTPVGLVLLTSGGNEPPVEVRIADELGVSTPR